jgi:hypothetical protein
MMFQEVLPSADAMTLQQALPSADNNARFEAVVKKAIAAEQQVVPPVMSPTSRPAAPPQGTMLQQWEQRLKPQLQQAYAWTRHWVQQAYTWALPRLQQAYAWILQQLSKYGLYNKK